MITITKELLSDWFKKFNRLYFNGEIKREPSYIITNHKSDYGQFSPSTWAIKISTAFIRSERNYINTFLHEMCHLYVREKYGLKVQPHGYEWEEIANTITRVTEGKYGVIKRVGGGLDKNVLRTNNKLNKYVVFIDYEGILSIAKYTNDEYVKQLLKDKCVMNNTEIRYYVSDNVEMAVMKTRRVNCRYIRWNHSKWGLDELDKIAKLVSTNIYSSLKQVA